MRREYKFAGFLNSDFQDQEIQMVLMKFLMRGRCWRDAEVITTDKQEGYASRKVMPITFLKSRNDVAEGFSRTINLVSRKRNGQTLTKSILSESRLTFSKDL